MRSVGRIVRHLCMTHWQVRRDFPVAVLQAIERAVQAAEQGHAGQIRVVIEGALPGQLLWRDVAARHRAIDVFSLSRAWDTGHNNGVLLYLLLADRDVEIVADRGIAARVAQQEWEAICREMEAAFRAGRFEQGIVTGVHAIAAKLAAHFPRAGEQTNELPDRPLLL